MTRINTKDLKYRCICRGECSPGLGGLGRCVMLTKEEDTICNWCKANRTGELKRLLRRSSTV